MLVMQATARALGTGEQVNANQAAPAQQRLPAQPDPHLDQHRNRPLVSPVAMHLRPMVAILFFASTLLLVVRWAAVRMRLKISIDRDTATLQ